MNENNKKEISVISIKQTYIRMKVFINFAVSFFITFLTVLFLPGLDVNGYLVALYIGLAIGVINICVKPLLEVCGIIPTSWTILTALFFMNGAVIVLADWMLEDLSIEGIGYVILFSAVVSILNWAIHKIIWK